jgi:hypothetical protein
VRRHRAAPFLSIQCASASRGTGRRTWAVEGLASATAKRERPPSGAKCLPPSTAMASCRRGLNREPRSPLLVPIRHGRDREKGRQGKLHPAAVGEPRSPATRRRRIGRGRLRLLAAAVMRGRNRQRKRSRGLVGKSLDSRRRHGVLRPSPAAHRPWAFFPPFGRHGREHGAERGNGRAPPCRRVVASSPATRRRRAGRRRSAVSSRRRARQRG